LETQFDHNQGFKTALLEKQSFEVRSQSFGRDRSGASYWLFMVKIFLFFAGLKLYLNSLG
jgi:hypothetical protein